jgi:glycosyltransferase involved in cell wall biosynthesis
VEITKKKLLVVTSEYFHPLTTRLHHMLPFFRERFEVKIVAITSSSYGSSKKGKDPIAIGNFVASTLISSILQKPIQSGEIITILSPIPQSRILTPIGHFLESVAIALIIKFRRIGDGYDVCLASPELAGFSTLLAKMSMPIVYEDVDRFEFFTNNHVKRKIVRFMESYCLRNSAEVISAGYNLTSSAELMRGKPVRFIPNGVNLKLFGRSLRIHDVRDKFGLVYVGYISEWSGLEKAIESLPLIISQFPDVKLFIIGTGEQQIINMLQTLAATLNIKSHVVFLGRKKHEELPQLMKGFVLGMATFPRTKLMHYAFPLKIMEYMAAELPIVATDVGDTGEILRKSGCGVLVDYTPTSIAAGVIRIIRNREYAELLVKNGQKWIKKFDLSNLAQEEANVLLSIISEV